MPTVEERRSVESPLTVEAPRAVDGAETLGLGSADLLLRDRESTTGSRTWRTAAPIDRCHLASSTRSTYAKLEISPCHVKRDG